MTKNQLKRLFVRFENFSDQHIHTQESTGIGLSLTKELVEMHHGTITVESQPNEGSCFTVTLQKVIVILTLILNSSYLKIL